MITFAPWTVRADPAEAAAASVPAASSAPVDVSVHGERSEGKKLQESAEAVTVIDLKNAKHQSADLGEVLARTQGVGVRRSGGLGSSSVLSLAGLQNDHIRTFVDGIPVELSGYPFGIVNIPVNLVERIEIYRGVVPARFGLDALGGAINVVTNRKQTSAVSASYQVGSFGTYRTNVNGRYRDESSGLVGAASLFLDLAKNNFMMNDRALSRPDGTSEIRTVPRFHDAYQAYGGHLEFGVVDRPWARRLMVEGFASKTHKEWQHNAVMTVPYGEVTSSEGTFGGNVHYEVALARALELELLATYAHRAINFRDMSEYRYRWTGDIARKLAVRGEAFGEIGDADGPVAVDTTTSENLWLGRVGVIGHLHTDHVARLYVTTQLVDRRSHDYVKARRNYGLVDTAVEVVAGLEYESDWFDKRLSNIIFGKVYWFSPTSEGRVVIPGIAPYVRSATRHTETFGGGDSLRFRITPWLITKASYEYAIRLPRADELFGNGLLVRKNTELQPESSHNINIGPRLELKGTPIGSVVGDVNAYWRETRDQILLLPSPSFAAYQNIANARTYGLENALMWQSPGRWLTLDGTVTWVESRNQSNKGPFAGFSGMRIPGRPFLFGSWGARFHAGGLPRPEDGLDFFYAGRYVRSFYRGWEGVGDAQFKMTVPAQMSHAVGVTYYKVFRDGRYSFSFEVDNVTDAALYDSWGVQRPGRAFNVKITGSL